MAVTAVAGCLPVQQAEEPAAPPPVSPLVGLDSADYGARIEQLAIKADAVFTSAAERAKCLRLLALLHLSPDNPARDYYKAAAALEKLARVSPDEAERIEAAIWLSRVRELLAQQQELLAFKEKERTCLDTEAENEQLEKRIVALQKNNSKLKQVIEELKHLDLSLEKKRKSFR